MICFIFGALVGIGFAIFCPDMFKKLNEKVLKVIKSDKCNHK